MPLDSRFYMKRPATRTTITDHGAGRMPRAVKGYSGVISRLPPKRRWPFASSRLRSEFGQTANTRRQSHPHNLCLVASQKSLMHSINSTRLLIIILVSMCSQVALGQSKKWIIPRRDLLCRKKAWRRPQVDAEVWRGRPGADGFATKAQRENHIDQWRCLIFPDPNPSWKDEMSLLLSP
jgi:hypothetical protein